MASSQDAWYLSLLGLAENFRTSNPPSIKLCIQCLQAVFTFKPPPRVEARTHLQLGNILLTHTNNIDLARTHLERAVCTLLYIIQSYVVLLFIYSTIITYSMYLLLLVNSGSLVKPSIPSMMSSLRLPVFWPIFISSNNKLL